ncbi:hypothetical protein [Pseudomonas sp. Teo4]|uniref:hypothetical protein n=1 Tax=Pseudomonas sp. Teo4 TaxID=3064528 RepID=UPI002ABADE9B|nr:hypothetical protein [Pseudomonas sp. Teo4]MDZ3991657.1 hypothetical protein [Pseudomonas sp. Teo4]
MNIDALHHAATQLRKLLEHHQMREPLAADLLHALGNLIARAEREEITVPMEPGDIPGHRYFTETNLGGYTELEAAYSVFYVELIDARSSEAFKKLQANMNNPDR